MAGKEHLEPQGFKLYRKNVDQKEIARILDLSEQTVSRYKKKYKWEERRRRWNNSSRSTAEKLRDLVAKKVEEMQDLDNMDAIHKAELVIEKVDGKMDRLAFTIDMSEDLHEFIKQAYPEMLDFFIEMLPEFLNWMAKKYGE